MADVDAMKRLGPGLAGHDLSAAGLHRGLRIAVAGICVIVLCLQGTTRLIGSLDQDRSPAGQIVAYCICLLVVVVDAVLAACGQTWGVLCWPMAALVLGTTLMSWVSLPIPPGNADWHYGLVGWLGIMILFERPLWVLLGFVSAHVGMSAILAVIVTDLDQLGLLALAAVSIEIVGLQVAAVVGTHVLRRVGQSAEAAVRRHEQTMVQDRISSAVSADRSTRYRDLDRDVLPLLVGLECGRFDPANPQVQLRCAIAAARLRRMFAETDDSADSLFNEMGAASDPAVRRGVLVSVETSGTTPPIPRPVRQALIDPLLPALMSASQTARVTLTSNDKVVSGSVVTDMAPGPHATDGARTEVTMTQECLSVDDGHDGSTAAVGLGYIVVTTIREGRAQWVQTQWLLA